MSKRVMFTVEVTFEAETAQAAYADLVGFMRLSPERPQHVDWASCHFVARNEDGSWTEEEDTASLVHAHFCGLKED